MTRTRLIRWRRVQLLLLFADIIAVGVGVRLAYLLRYGPDVRPVIGQPLPGFDPRYMLVIALAWIVAFNFYGLYRRRNVVSGIGEYRRVASAGLLVTLGIVVVSFSLAHTDIARGFLLLVLMIVTGLVWVGRFLCRQAIYYMGTRGRVIDRVLVVGANRQAVAVAAQLAASRSASCEVVGMLSDYLPEGTTVNDLEVLGEPLQLERIAAEVGANRAIVVESGLSWESHRHVVTLMHTAQAVDIALVPGLFDLHATPMSAQQLGSVLTLVPEPSRLVGAEALMKRGVDIVLVLLALVVALPIMALLCLISVLTTGTIRMETMRAMGEGRPLYLRSFANPGWAAEHHLSRLPDLFQILRGRMSLIGPRPIPDDRAEAYVKARPFLDSLRPGFLGPWWLVGASRPDDVDTELAYDLYYLRNYSVWLDVQILLRIAVTLVVNREMFRLEENLRGPRGRARKPVVAGQDRAS